jgi:hypothetical protein
MNIVLIVLLVIPVVNASVTVEMDDPMAMQCENPRHKQHLEAFLKKYPTADKNANFAIIAVNPKEWWNADLSHPENNTAQCCQMCSIQEGINQTGSPDWTSQPAPADHCSCQWKVRY